MYIIIKYKYNIKIIIKMQCKQVKNLDTPEFQRELESYNDMALKKKCH